MKTWILKYKIIITIFLLVGFFGYFIPKQDCLDSISLGYGDDYKYGQEKFKTRNDALDYCMARHWGLLF